MERTLILCKPDCLEKNLAGEVLARLERAGLRLAGAKMMRLTPALLAEHYAHLKDRPFFPEIVTFMSSRAVLALILQGDNAVARVRELLGPTDSKKAAQGTIRGDWGTDNMRNIAHASDSAENAELEVRRFFRPEELPA
ncbi:MAG TPA: nucleoside-diphosphate kinase [Verrucomicrobiota bacterium]|nr:nucleoside-diphosphate kinase [Verrucomicrobiales bacterium]HRI16528.1 nucleoside-diphosphate kinase [Verrucomicrobiota bacterium]